MLVSVCLNSKRGSPLGTRKTDTQYQRVLVLADVLGKQTSFGILVSTTPTSSEK